jgi:hypothetical protein
MMTFEQELSELVEQMRADNRLHVEIEAAVAELHRKHGREIPPPITGTLTLVEPKDDFGK